MKCSPHTAGVPPDLGPFFQADCSVCQAKLAAGKVTGLEPRPKNTSRQRIRATMAHGFGMQGDKRMPFSKRGDY